MYTFSHEQLGKMLHGAIETFLEFRDWHGYPEERARFSAVTELLDGLDAERQLVSDGEIARATTQVLNDQEQPPVGVALCEVSGNGNAVRHLQIAADANLIQVQINILQAHMEDLLRQDPEYAEYLDAHAERGTGQPLGILEFHRMQNELSNISRRFNGLGIPDDGDRIERLWQQYRRRILELEQILLA